MFPNYTADRHRLDKLNMQTKGLTTEHTENTESELPLIHPFPSIPSIPWLPISVNYRR